jgi:hypothetical protein
MSRASWYELNPLHAAVAQQDFKRAHVPALEVHQLSTPAVIRHFDAQHSPGEPQRARAARHSGPADCRPRKNWHVGRRSVPQKFTHDLRQPGSGLLHLVAQDF